MVSGSVGTGMAVSMPNAFDSTSPHTCDSFPQHLVLTLRLRARAQGVWSLGQVQVSMATYALPSNWQGTG